MEYMKALQSQKVVLILSKKELKMLKYELRMK